MTLSAAGIMLAASAATLAPGASEVVVPAGSPPIVAFAGAELTNFLSRVLGSPVPLVREPTDGHVAIMLGENAWSKAAGLSVEGLPRDTFVSSMKDGRLYILGKDDATYDIYENLDKGYGHAPLLYGHERATLFGVYDFLERHADCRLYFPGELGECVPRKDRIVVPDGTRIVTPPFLIRNLYLNGTGKWFNAAKADDKTDCRMKSLEWLRLRLSTMEIPCCHGSQWFKYRERFGLKGRPDFMALKKDGTRWLDPKGHFAPNQLCWSNPDLHEEMYQDVKAYLTGQPAASRRLEKWNVNCQWNYVDIMPDDSFSPCECPRCQAAYRFDKGRDFASELMWGVAGKLAQRLIDEGVDGNVTLLAYEPYGRVPEGVDLPTNVYVEVARTGPWTMVDPDKMARENQLLKDWNAKLGHKVWTWTYPHQYGVTRIKGVSCFAPRAWGKYYQSVAPWTFGTFAECEAEKAMYNHLNYYLFSRVAWDPSVDVDATVDEYYVRMFGAGAPEMKSFFDALERIWTRQIVGKVVNTPVGPVASPPSEDQLWTEVLSPSVRARFDELLRTAEGKVAAGSLEARRIALMKREFFDDMAEAVADWQRQREKVDAYVHDAAKGPLKTVIKNCDIWGRPKDAEKLSAETQFTLKRTTDALIVDVDCEEPDFANTVAVARKDDDIGCWEDNNVEILLNPSDDGKNVYHVMYTTAGNFVDIKWTRVGAKAGQPNMGWSSKGLHTWVRTARGWKAHIEIPLASFDEPVKDSFRANFGRGRVTRTVSEHAMWSKYAKEYHDFQNWGRIVLKEPLTLRPGKVEVVASDTDAPAVRFAVAELTNFLSCALGASVPARSAPSGGAGVVAIRLGGAQAKEAGVDVATFAHDEFLTRVDANGVLIAGRDNPRYDLPRAVREGQGYAPLIGYGTEEDAERATLLGVYDFLERYAGVRFYLPDELGTIVSRTGEIAVPFGDGRTKPNFLIREPYMGGDGKWPVLNPADPQDDERRRMLLWLRQRHSTTLIPCCHGSQHFKYIQRFAKTHPEYLALKQDGSRWDDLGVFAANQFCWSNPGFRETLYQDTKAYLTGAPASSRGLAHWGYNCKFHRYVDIMPEDSFSDCHCARCQAAYVRRPGDTHYATELIWGVTAQLAQRLIDEGVAGSVTQMAYEPYGRVPDFALPTNVQVMVARTGPWSMAHPEKVAAEERHFRAWSEKLGHRVWAWTYPQKFGRTAIKGVPCLAPRAWGEYFKRMSPWIFGSFVECESDKSIYNHLNYYVFSRVAWDAHVDVEAVLREYHELMFGAGAADMAKFNRILEEKWLNDVAGRIEETSLGPIAKVPSAYQLWHDVYSPAVRAELQACLRQATEKTSPDSSERRRIALMKREFYDPLVQEAEAFELATDLRHGLALRAKEPNRSILSDDWKDWDGNFEVDTSTFVTPPSSVRFSGTNTAAVAFPLQGRAGKPALKPNTRYRLTYFVKTEDVEPRAMYGGGGGIAVNVYDDHNRWFPDRNFFTGTMGWIFQSYEFTSGPNTNDPAKGADARSYLWLHRLNAAGTAWFDDVRLEEVKEEK